MLNEGKTAEMFRATYSKHLDGRYRLWVSKDYILYFLCVCVCVCVCVFIYACVCNLRCKIIQTDEFNFRTLEVDA